MVHISVMSGKLKGIPAINTNTLSNAFCTAMHNAKKSVICAWCYSHNMLSGSRKNCVAKFEENSRLLAEWIPWEELPVFNSLWVRFHGHGELQNMAHLENFHRIALKNPRTICTLWSKRRDLIREYHRNFTQPNNLILIYSNPIIDRVIARPPTGFNRVFNNVSQHDNLENCTGRICTECLSCYSQDGDRMIVERVKIRH